MTEDLGRYRILEELGRGGFAIVHWAHDTALDRYVALKELRPTLLPDTEWVKRFKREAKTIASLDHRYIVPIYDVVELAERLFIVMRLVDGLGLDNLLATQGPLPWSQALLLSWTPQGRRSWSLSISNERLKPEQSAIEVGLKQVKALCQTRPDPLKRVLDVIVGDGQYGITFLADYRA